MLFVDPMFDGEVHANTSLLLTEMAMYVIDDENGFEETILFSTCSRKSCARQALDSKLKPEILHLPENLYALPRGPRS